MMGNKLSRALHCPAKEDVSLGHTSTSETRHTDILRGRNRPVFEVEGEAG